MKVLLLAAGLVLTACAADRSTPGRAPGSAPGASGAPGAPETANAPDAAPSNEAFSVEIVPLQFASADELAELLGRIDLSKPRTRVVPEHRTNSLLLQGPRDGIDRARELIRALDVAKR
jgi:type II secretory pathway component GspD/PulD (secretin)